VRQLLRLLVLRQLLRLLVLRKTFCKYDKLVAKHVTNARALAPKSTDQVPALNTGGEGNWTGKPLHEDALALVDVFFATEGRDGRLTKSHVESMLPVWQRTMPERFHLNDTLNIILAPRVCEVQ